MVQIVNRSPNFGDSVTRNLGNIAELYIDKQKKAKESVKTARALQRMGIPEDVSTGIANMPKHLQEISLKNWQNEKQQDDFREMLGLPAREKPTPKPAEKKEPNFLEKLMGRLFHGRGNAEVSYPEINAAEQPQLGTMQQIMGSNNWMQQPQQNPIQNLFNQPQQQNPTQQMMGQVQQPSMMNQGQLPQESTQQQPKYTFDPENMSLKQRIAAINLTPDKDKQFMAALLSEPIKAKAAELSAERIAKRQEDAGERIAKRQEEAGIRAEDRAEQAGLRAEKRAETTSERTAIKEANTERRKDFNTLKKDYSKSYELNESINKKAQLALSLLKKASPKLNYLRRQGTDLPLVGRLEPDKSIADLKRAEEDLLASLTQAGASGTGGRLTNMFMDLMRKAKVGISLPVETQEQGLKMIIDETKLKRGHKSIMNNLSEKWGTNVPEDYEKQLESALNNFDIEKSPFFHPEEYKEGTQIEYLGKIYEKVDGDWEEVED